MCHAYVYGTIALELKHYNQRVFRISVSPMNVRDNTFVFKLYIRGRVANTSYFKVEFD